MGHWRRARGRGSGELRGLSAREDVGGSKAGVTSPVVTGEAGETLESREYLFLLGRNLL